VAQQCILGIGRLIVEVFKSHTPVRTPLHKW